MDEGNVTATSSTTGGADPARGGTAAGDVERAVLALASKLLRVPVTLEDNFFQAGGDSLAALEFVTLLEEELGRGQLPIELVFDEPTFGDLCRAITGMNRP